ncbi:hypothetical protein KIF53_14965 [Chromobacterium subtsugae]|uniref:Mannosyltransferase n=1 Tax=Chromobacterium subtsugae TaxID=251747 RepID=A0ABS7FFT0_9NEIS|nr:MULTISPECIES: glycosyltransferase [Chromobacterium]MBW7567708.1 hypothetical protein [Chromobacterium subtsugae]MBW8288934.1 hypothetical protein [Chromobacterium subtsugae]WSE91273.1 glycosyltransferase [Chromobacterium subtsugae]WVH59648.1 glycosyltransferase [Chromobacterium subtsugae]
MIPKIIHHIWLGDNDLPAQFKKFIDDARELLPDYEFKLWNESNIDLESPFVKRNYAAKNWAFVSDYVRFKILSEEGGIYLDTDMEVLKNFDELLDCSGFAGLNRQESAIYCGIIGCMKGLPLMTAVLKKYDQLPDGVNPTSPDILTQAYIEIQESSFLIYPAQAFYPTEEGEKITKQSLIESYTIHHWGESWRSYVHLRRVLRRIGLMGIYHKFTRKKGILKSNLHIHSGPLA